ncbi:MAG TPA: regulatory protein RecX [Chitinophagaceae bacterium]
MTERNSKTFTPEQAFAKAKHYCAYQERSHSEVKEKLYSFGLRKTDVETLLSRLIEENYLNEERFARQFAGGRFRIKKWGRVKILYHLKQKRVSAYNIRLAMEEIDEAKYQELVAKLGAAKWRALKNQPLISRQAKTFQYLTGRGFEPALVKNVIATLRKEATG